MKNDVLIGHTYVLFDGVYCVTGIDGDLCTISHIHDIEKKRYVTKNNLIGKEWYRAFK